MTGTASGVTWGSALVGAALVLGAATTAAAGAPLPAVAAAVAPVVPGEAVTSADGVEVSTYGAVSVTPDNATENGTVVQAVHAVQRVGDRTVVYWSMGSAQDEDFLQFRTYGRDPFNQKTIDTFATAPYVNIALPGPGQLLYAVPDPDDIDRASTSDRAALPQEPGVMAVMYSVLTGLSEDVETVDVMLGHSGVVTDVPVGEGLLEPVAPEAYVPLGSGWPEVEERFLQPVENLSYSVRPLVSQTEQLDGSSREAEVGEEVTIDIAADVLFAFDSAELSPAAVARLQEVAAEVTDRAAPGQLLVIGHTDSDADDAYNDDLSRRRAQAVADVLTPALAGAPLQLVVEGRGEREPVADNSAEEGRALNRRVAVTFTAEAGR